MDLKIKLLIGIKLLLYICHQTSVFGRWQNILSPSKNWSLVSNIQQQLYANKQYYLLIQLFNYNLTIFTCLLNYSKLPAVYQNITLELPAEYFGILLEVLIYSCSKKIISLYTHCKRLANSLSLQIGSGVLLSVEWEVFSVIFVVCFFSLIIFIYSLFVQL